MSCVRYFVVVLAIVSPTISIGALKEEISADFYVSTEGNDAWSGGLPTANAQLTDGPVATVRRAQELVRSLRVTQTDLKRPVVVGIRGGVYPLAKPIRFAVEDGGTEQSPTIYQAFGDGRPVLSGGTRITGWRVDDDGSWRVTLPEIAAGRWTFGQLFVNGQRRFRPRFPKTGNYTIAGEAPPSTEVLGFDRFLFSGNDMRPDWMNLRDVEALVFHRWSASRLRIESIDPEQRLVKFTGSTFNRAPYLLMNTGSRYHLENVREALSQPGQWYLDRTTGELTYIPMPGENPAEATVVAPRISVLVEFVGNSQKKAWVKYIQFRGIEFAYTNWELPVAGHSEVQAEVMLPSAIEATGTRHIIIDSCTVQHVGCYALAFGEGCSKNQIENCEFVDLGAGGIKIGVSGNTELVGPDVEDSSVDASETSHHTIRNCTIAHGGRVHPAGVGVWIGHASHNRIEHNDIFDFFYTGVSVGWQWDYLPTRSHDNKVLFNHIHTIGQRVLSDMGGVYTLGISPGTVVSNNHIHDIESFDDGGWGLYADQGSSGIVMENNLVYRTATGGFHQHWGRENRIVNNIFAYGKVQQLQRGKAEGHLSFTFERNIVLWDNDSPLLADQWRDKGVIRDYNLYWHIGSKPIDVINGLTFQEWQKQSGQDQHSRVADPQFVDAAKGNFHLNPESPAFNLGFLPFDYMTAGRLKRSDDK